MATNKPKAVKPSVSEPARCQHQERHVSDGRTWRCESCGAENPKPVIAPQPTESEIYQDALDRMQTAVSMALDQLQTRAGFAAVTWFQHEYGLAVNELNVLTPDEVVAKRKGLPTPTGRKLPEAAPQGVGKLSPEPGQQVSSEDGVSNGTRWDGRTPDSISAPSPSPKGRLGVTVSSSLESTKGVEGIGQTAREWRCYHCNEVFTEPEAGEHFGSGEYEALGMPLCVSELRSDERVRLHELRLATDKLAAAEAQTLTLRAELQQAKGHTCPSHANSITILRECVPCMVAENVVELRDELRRLQIRDDERDQLRNVVSLNEWKKMKPWAQGYTLYMEEELPGSELKKQKNPYSAGTKEYCEFEQGQFQAVLNAQDSDD